MIIGIGNDICNEARVAKAYERHGMRFMERILTSAELSEMETRSHKVNYLAKHFAAKEAIYKAIAHKISPPPSWHDAEILHDEAGRPLVTLSNRCHNALSDLTTSGQSLSYHLSLSDDKPYIFAVFIASIQISDNA